MSLIQRFTRNLVGRDFLIGDLHGCFHVLTQMLKHINFDETKDRLFAIGDLVDRGPYSYDVLVWLARIWFRSIRGNHEQMAIGIFAGRHDLPTYMANGGAWFLRLSEGEQRAIVEVFQALPLAMEIDTPHGVIGVVHAEPMDSWTEMVATLERAETLSKGKLHSLMEQCLWSRRRIRQPDMNVREYRDPATWDRTPIEGISRVYVGHSPMPEPTMVGNIAYIDTGMGKGGTLTCVDLADPDNPYTM